MDKKYFIILVVGLYSASVFSAHEGDLGSLDGDGFDDVLLHDVTTGPVHARHRDPVDTQQQTTGHAIARALSRTDQSGSSVPVRLSSVAVDGFGDVPISRTAEQRSQSIISSLDARTIDEMTGDDDSDDSAAVAVTEKGVTILPRKLTYAEVRLKAKLEDQRDSLATAIANLKGEAFNEDGSLRPGKALLVQKIIKLQNQDFELLKQWLVLEGKAVNPSPEILSIVAKKEAISKQINDLEAQIAMDRKTLADDNASVANGQGSLLSESAKRKLNGWITARTAELAKLSVQFEKLQ